MYIEQNMTSLKKKCSYVDKGRFMLCDKFVTDLKCAVPHTVSGWGSHQKDQPKPQQTMPEVSSSCFFCCNDMNSLQFDSI